MLKQALTQHFTTCCSCRRPNVVGSPDYDDWALQHFLMIPVAMKCPDCQSPEERAEIAIRQASGVNYKLDGFRLVEDPGTPMDDGEGGAEPKAS
jgi:hypothetical protein